MSTISTVPGGASSPAEPPDDTGSAGPAGAEPSDEAGERATAPDSDHVGAHRRRRRGLILAVVLVAGVGAGAGITYAVTGDESAATAGSGAPTSLATVERRNLVQTASYDGTLSYANSRPLAASGQGVVTRLPAVGGTIVQGQSLFSINEAPTLLLYGPVPMYRTLQAGVADGSDVAQLETDLHALGFDPDAMTIDNTFTAATADAINAWKASLGLAQDGTVTPAEISFQSGPLHVEATNLQVGENAAPNAPVLTVTDLARVVTVPLQSTDAAIAHPGDAVTIGLPDGSSVPGAVFSVGQNASSAGSAGSAGSSSSASSAGGAASTGGANTGGGSVNAGGASAATTSATVNVTVVVNQAAAAGNLDTAPVTVAFTQQRASGVLAVPVPALLALAGGGYAVQAADAAGGTHLVSVTPGLYAADGMVQISGPGVAAGMRVVVPAGD